METRKWALVAGVLLVGVISGNLANSSARGRSAKILEDPIMPHIWNPDASSVLQDPSNRSLSVENNMMLYRTVFTLSLKLLTLFLIVKLFGQAIGGIKQRPVPIVPFQPGQGQEPLYTLDVNQNPAGTLIQATSTSTGAAAGASTGGAAGVLAGAGINPQGGYAAATNARPSFLYPTGPRFRFGGPRHPPPRHGPPPNQMMGPGGVAQHNMGTETHLVETHSHLYVLPDGTQARVPVVPLVSQTTPVGNKPAESSNNDATSSATSEQQSQQNSDTEAKSASSDSDNAAESRPVETVVSTSSSTSSSSSAPQVAERRSFNDYREQFHHLQQSYEDWNLHFNPGV